MNITKKHLSLPRYCARKRELLKPFGDLMLINLD